MTCKPRVKILNTGASLDVPTTVRDIAVSGSSLIVSLSDGTSKEVALPPAPPANVEEVNVLNATGERIVATVAKLK